MIKIILDEIVLQAMNTQEWSGCNLSKIMDRKERLEYEERMQSYYLALDYVRFLFFSFTF